MQDFFYIKVYRRDSMDPSLSGLCATGNLWPLLRPWSVQAEARPFPDLFHPLRSQQGWMKRWRGFLSEMTGRAEWSLDSWGHPPLGRAPTTLHEHGLRYSWETQVQGGTGGSKGVEGVEGMRLQNNHCHKIQALTTSQLFVSGHSKMHVNGNTHPSMCPVSGGEKLPSIRTFWEFFVNLQRSMSVHSETL